jgi:hypothetical protein
VERSSAERLMYRIMIRRRVAPGPEPDRRYSSGERFKTNWSHEIEAADLPRARAKARRWLRREIDMPEFTRVRFFPVTDTFGFLDIEDAY